MNKTSFSIVVIVFLGLVVFTSCEEDAPNPKPPTFLKQEFPQHSYHIEKGVAPFQFNISDYCTLKPSVNCNEYYCEQEIYLGKEFNGNINLFYKKVDHPDSIGGLINFSNQEVDFHKMKASDIAYDQIIDNESKVYGTLFELKGDAATNFQFYLTDSLQNFVRGELVLNCVPKYDSLRHVLSYLKVDLTEMINTFEWQQD